MNVIVAALHEAFRLRAARLAGAFSACDDVSAGAAYAALRSLVLERFEAIAPAFRRWNSEEASHGLALRHHERSDTNVAGPHRSARDD
jgi:hypothetical protein